MPELNGAGAIVYLRDDHKPLFLLLRSVRHGEWGAPKGHAEPGEMPVETASRELFEEAGLRRVTFVPGFETTITYPVVKKGQTYTKHVTYFLCEIEEHQVDGLRLSPEHNEIHLATLAEVEVLITHEALREVFRQAAKALRG